MGPDKAGGAIGCVIWVRCVSQVMAEMTGVRRCALLPSSHPFVHLYHLGSIFKTFSVDED